MSFYYYLSIYFKIKCDDWKIFNRTSFDKVCRFQAVMYYYYIHYIYLSIYLSIYPSICQIGLDTPVPVRSPNLSNVKPGHYPDGWPSMNTRSHTLVQPYTDACGVRTQNLTSCHIVSQQESHKYKLYGFLNLAIYGHYVKTGKIKKNKGKLKDTMILEVEFCIESLGWECLGFNNPSILSL